MVKKIFTISLVLIIALSFVACTGGDEGEAGLPSAQEIIDGVIEAQDDIRTYQFDVDMTMDMAFEVEDEAFEQDMAMGFSGAFDLENSRMWLDMTMSTAATGEDEMEVEMEMYLIGDMVYTMVEDPETGSMWEKSEMTPEFWEEVNQYINQVEPQMELLEVVQVEVIGSEKVGGVDCYVLQLTPDMEQLWQLAMQQAGVTGELVLPDIGEEFLREAFKNFSVKQWVAKDTYFLTKVEMYMAMELTPEALGYPEEEGLMTMDITMNLLAYNYNQPVSIVLPQEAEEVVEVPIY